MDAEVLEVNIEQAYKLLTGLHKALKIKFDEEIEYWKPDPLLSTVMTGSFGEVLVEQESEFTDEEYRSVFSAVENLLLNYNEEVGTAVATGLLEALIQLSDQRNPARFVYFLGEEAKKYCIAWDEFTGVKTPGLY